MKRYLSLTAVILSLIMLSLAIIPAAGAEFSGEDRVIVVLDPGHGGTGEPSPYNYSEASYNMRVAQYMKAALESDPSFIVYLTNEDYNTDPSHYERAVFADSVNADIMISIHFNSTVNTATRGIEAWTSVIERYDLANLGQMFVDYAVKAVPALPVSGVYQRKDSAGFYWNESYQWDVEGDPTSGMLSDYYGIITWGLKFGVPTFIIEEMYLSNAEDTALATDENLQLIAKAQAQALIDYYTGHEHTYGEVQVDVPLTCITVGKQSSHCTVCGHRKNVSTIADAPDPDAHYYRMENENDPDGAWTCVYTESLIKKAKIEYTAHSGDSVPEGVDAALPIVNSTGTVTVPTAQTQTQTPTPAPVTPTVTEPQVGEDGHIHSYRIVDAMQTMYNAPGYAVYRCDECRDTYRIEMVMGQYDCAVDGHVAYPDDEYTVNNTLPTCDEPGVTHYFCLHCATAYTEETPALGHELTVQSETAPTCVTEGSKVEVCTKCTERVVTPIAAVGHSYEQSLSVPDCESGGQRTDVCSACGKTLTEQLLPNGHSYESVTLKEAGLLSAGEREHTCTVCGKSYTESIRATVPLPVLAVAILVAIVLLAAIIASLLRPNGKKRSDDTPATPEEAEAADPATADGGEAPEDEAVEEPIYSPSEVGDKEVTAEHPAVTDEVAVDIELSGERSDTTAEDILAHLPELDLGDISIPDSEETEEEVPEFATELLAELAAHDSQGTPDPDISGAIEKLKERTGADKTDSGEEGASDPSDPRTNALAALRDSMNKRKSEEDE